MANHHVTGQDVGSRKDAQVRLLWREIGSVALLGVVLGGFGPFGTFQAPVTERVVYWTFILLVSYLFFRPAVRLSDRLAGGNGRDRIIGRLVAVGLVGAPLTMIVWLASFLHTPTLWPSLRHLAGMYPSVLFVGAVMVVLLDLVERIHDGRRALADTPAEPSGEYAPATRTQPGRPRFFARLPFHMREELVALQVEDHYVRAHTTHSNVLLLMRMSDAIAEMDGYPGAQVHRSWWVASHAVREVQGPSRSRRLVLSNGLTVPVARAREDTVNQLLQVRELSAA